MSRTEAIDRVLALFDDGRFLATLSRRVAFRTESHDPASGPILRSYLHDEIATSLGALGFTSRIVDNPVSERAPSCSPSGSNPVRRSPS